MKFAVMLGVGITLMVFFLTPDAFSINAFQLVVLLCLACGVGHFIWPGRRRI